MLKLIPYIAFYLLAAQITFSTANGKEPVWKATGSPLTTEEARAALAGNSLLGKTKRGTKVKFYFSDRMEAYRVLESGPVEQEFHLLRGGILCWRRPDSQFCYRIFMDGDAYAFAFLNLAISHQGKILPGDAFGVE